MKIRACAKVNLFLEVRSRRKDGYHEICSLMQAIGLYDDITMLKTPAGISVRTIGSDLPDDERNLAYRAADALKRKTGTVSGARIILRKHIPLGAGLGGGSSDAAAVLVGLNRLWKCGLDGSALRRIGATLGSDVPFFISGGTAVSRGRGERITSLPDAPRTTIVVAYPGFGVPTPWAYKRMRFPLTNEQKITNIISLVKPGRASFRWDRILFNRLESVVLPAYPRIARIKAVMERSGFPALMSGSGSTVFCVVPSVARGRALEKKLKSYASFTRTVAFAPAGRAGR